MADLYRIVSVSISDNVFAPKLRQWGPPILGLFVLSALLTKAWVDFEFQRRLATDVAQSEAAKVSLSPSSTITEPLAVFSLMGRAPVVEPGVKVEEDQPLPVEVQLKGTFTDSLDGAASALISVGGGMAKRYFVGDTLYEDMQVINVSHDHVELKQGAATRRIYFPFAEERLPAMPRNRRTVLQALPSAPSPSEQEISLKERIQNLREQHDQ